jgi:predicted TIM-barrel fold metal-dependent hydrolase
LIEEVLVHHPKLRIYIMHAAWPMLDEIIHILYSHPQVYVDIGVIDWFIPREEFYFYLKRIVNAGFGKRILFGSDQMYWPDKITEAIKTIDSADFLNYQQKRDIFYNNAVQFLRFNSEKAKL